jgi:hypothetical protein
MWSYEKPSSPFAKTEFSIFTERVQPDLYCKYII